MVGLFDSERSVDGSWDISVYFFQLLVIWISSIWLAICLGTYLLEVKMIFCPGDVTYGSFKNLCVYTHIYIGTRVQYRNGGVLGIYLSCLST